MKRKVLLIFLSLASAACFLSAAAACGKTTPTTEPTTQPTTEPTTEPSDAASEGLAFSLTEDGAGYLVTGLGSCTDSALVIPAAYEGKPVTGIAEWAFSECETLESVSIPASVKAIGAYSFYFCTALRSAELSSSLLRIGEAAFGYCEALTAVTLPNSLETLDKWAFFGCTALQTVTVPACVREIGDWAFACCEALSSAEVACVPESAGQGIFAACSILTSVSLPEGWTEIPNGMFFECISLETVALPSSVRVLSEYAFQNCYAFVGTTLPEGLTEIKDSVFYNCDCMEQITLPASLTEIGEEAFFSCDRLQRFEVAAGNPALAAEDGVLFNRAKTKLLSYPSGRVGEYRVPEGVTEIGAAAFYDCDALTKVILSSTVTEIDSLAFSEDTGLEAFEVAAGNPALRSENGVLFDRDGTTLVCYPGGREGAYEIPAAVTEIADCAFYGCLVTEVTIPAAVTEIGEEVFCHCGQLTRIAVAAENPAFCDKDGVLFDKDGATLLFFPGGRADVYDVPAGVREIGAHAFDGCGNLAGVTFAEGLRKIDRCAFYDCIGISSVILPDSLEEIGEEAFFGCSSLEWAVFGLGLQTIEDGAFSDCESLADVYCRGTWEAWNAVDSVETFGGVFFHYEYTEG